MVEAADRIIAVSEGMREDICGFRVDPDRMRWSTRPSRRMPQPPARRALGRLDPRPYVLFVGRITEQKGLDLVEAAAALPPGAGGPRARPRHARDQARLRRTVEGRTNLGGSARCCPSTR
jgi:hypothetical protein